MVDQIRLMERKLQWRESWVALGISDERHQTTSWTTGRGDEARPATQQSQLGKPGKAGAIGEKPTAKCRAGQGCKRRNTGFLVSTS